MPAASDVHSPEQPLLPSSDNRHAEPTRAFLSTHAPFSQDMLQSEPTWSPHTRPFMSVVVNPTVAIGTQLGAPFVPSQQMPWHSVAAPAASGSQGNPKVAVEQSPVIGCSRAPGTGTCSPSPEEHAQASTQQTATVR
jgi:hypothetical protein